MNEHGESDSPIVPEKPANKVWLQNQPAAEPVEERGLAEGNPSKQTSCRAQDRERLPNALRRIRQATARHYPRQEPSAVVPHAGIYPGGTG